jgi:sugar phosphate isomerase/epimerase
MNLFVQAYGEIEKNIINFAENNGYSLEIASFTDPDLLENKLFLNSFINALNKKLINFSNVLSLHGPFNGLDYTTKDNEIRRAIISKMTKTLECARKLNAKYVIFHSTYNPLIKIKNYKRKWIDSNLYFWEAFTKNLNYDGTILIENIWEQTPDILNSLITEINSKVCDKIKLLIDIGHINVYSNLSPYFWIESLYENIEYFHFSNNYGKIDEHNSLDDGTLNYEKILDYITGFLENPNISLEIHDSFEKVKKSIRILENTNSVKENTQKYNETDKKSYGKNVF